MKATDALKVLKTGTPLFVAGQSFESKVIEVLEGGEISHEATYYQDADEEGTPVDMVAEFNERDGGILNAGFQIVPFATWLTQQTGPIYFGTAPQEVINHPEKVLAFIKWYEDHPHYQHYGFLSLFPIFVNHWLNKADLDVNIPIERWSEVCDTFGIALENTAGDDLPTNETPDDMAKHFLPLTLIN